VGAAQEMATGSTSRKAKKLALFEAIDKDGDGYLNQGEMMQLAKLVGFDGDTEEWKKEYHALCTEVKASESEGVPKAVVLKMLDDTSDTGCFCTDEELQLLLSAQPRPGAKRQKEDIGNDAKVRFSGASSDIAEDTLRKFFGRAGEVLALNLFKLKDGQSRGMGMVTYKNAKQAKQALLQLNNNKVQGWTISVYTDHENDSTTQKPPALGETYAAWYGKGTTGKRQSGSSGEGSSEGCSISFDGAPLEMSSDRLYSMFEECGKIKSFWLFRQPDGRSRGQGLVEYSSQKDARSAINYLNGWLIGSSTLTVQEDRVGASAESQGTWADKGEDWWDGHSVFFSGAPSQLPVGRVQSYFREYGAVESFHMFRHPSGKPKGIGVVTFKDAHAATEVLSHGIEIEGWPLYLREAEDRGERGGAVFSEREQWASYHTEWESGSEVDPGKSIFFANVPFLSSERELQKRFASVGVINSFHLFKRQDGSSRGMGVVEYVTTAAARRAVNTLSESNIDGRYVLIQPYNRQYYSAY